MLYCPGSTVSGQNANEKYDIWGTKKEKRVMYFNAFHFICNSKLGTDYYICTSSVCFALPAFRYTYLYL